MAAMGSMDDLPDEVIEAILFHLSPAALSAVFPVSRRLNTIANAPILWRTLCQSSYHYWDDAENFKDKVRGRLDGVDWKLLFYSRQRLDRETLQDLESILSNQAGRIEKIRTIGNRGYNVKDLLIHHVETPDHAEDVLARRYWANTVLGHLHRSLAIDTWCRLARGEEVPLERALGAFDLFVLHNESGDIEETSDRLDRSAKQCQEEDAEWSERTVVEKALAVVRFIRQEQLTGIPPNRRYCDLRNSFIGASLRGDEHAALPLISVAIYCAIAQRLGVDARPCGFPFHVHALVELPEAEWRRSPLDENERITRIYLDPFRSNEEVPLESLRAQLRQLGSPSTSHAAHLGPTTVTEMVLRNCRNIMSSAQEYRRSEILTRELGPPDINVSNGAFTYLDLETAFYAAVWASLILGSQVGAPPGEPGGADESQQAMLLQRRQFYPYILQTFEQHFPEDGGLLERLIAPLFDSEPAGIGMKRTIWAIDAADRAKRTPKTRQSTEPSLRPVKYRVGQVFEHARYRYHAVITGWDPRCNAPEQWVRTQRVDELTAGRQQSFYNVLVDEDKSMRYVAEENMRLISREGTPTEAGSTQPDFEPSERMKVMAGRYLKRWDQETWSFVPNMKDEYPED